MASVIEQVIGQTARPTATSNIARPLSVCHISLGLATGGLERLLVDFARFHDRTGHRLVFVALYDEGRPAQEIRSAGCDVIALRSKGKSRWRRVRDLMRIFREYEIQVVHTHNAFAHVYGTVAARWAGVPLVINTRHGQRIGHGWKTECQYRFVSRWADGMVCVSEDAAKLSREKDRIPARKVRCIWNGIDLERFRFCGPAVRPWAISVGRLSPEKDFPTMVRAASLAAPYIPGFRLRIVGNGPERERLETLVRELNAGNCIELLGERSDIPELLKDSGFYICSSLTEGVSLTLLEAMAVGLPILATRVGGNPEVVVEGQTGRLVPAGDPQLLADEIVSFCRDSEGWPTMGLLGRRRVEEHFDIRRTVRDYESFYQELIAAR